MKKICIFLLVFCLSFQPPALFVQASGGETEEGSQAQNNTPPAAAQEQHNSTPSSETQDQSSAGAPAAETKGQEEKAEEIAAEGRSADQELPEKASPGEKLPGKEVEESILGKIAQSGQTSGETLGETAQENPGDEAAPTAGDSIGISAPSAVLMEASTGTVVLEKNAHEKLPPASVTKIMTLLLIFDAISQGKIRLEDTVTTSAYAASMGGSQVFLEEGETQSVDTMIKCISVASANDASVAMAEYVAGTEELFVEMMNNRAAELGMKDTHFVNCCGLDVDGHVTTAYDIALMSRELITKYPQIHNYSTVWMENITHTTKRGTEEFGLTNTNKLIRQYPYATGLKTGSTSLAKYCVSATAEKDGIEMIAVVMAAPDPKGRFADATALLNYGYAKCSLYQDLEEQPDVIVPIRFGVKEEVKGTYDGTFAYLSTTGEDLTAIEKKWLCVKELTAPVEEGQEIGKLTYMLGDKELGSISIVASEAVEKAGYSEYLKRTFDYMLL